MNTNDSKKGTNRRAFLGTMATGAAAFGFTTLSPSLTAFAGEANFNPAVYGDPEEMFKKITGKHRVVFDVPEPNGVAPFAWPRVFLMTNGATGTPEKECSVVVILRHEGIPFAFEDWVWEKYKFGEVFKVDDAATKAPSIRNTFWKQKPGTFIIPGFGDVPMGIDQLQASGVQFGVCNAAMTVYSAVVAGGMNMKAEDVKKDWEKGLLPGMNIMPSGVWALGRAQEKQCAYIYAG